MLSSVTPAHTGMSGVPGATSSRVEGVAGPRLLLSDAVVALLLADEARYRAMARLFGIPRQGSLLVSVVATGTLAGAIHAKLRLGARPGVGDALLGAASVGELMHVIAGPPSRDTRFFGGLVGIALVGGLLAPAVRESARGIKASSHWLRAEFGRRYGYVLAAGRRATAASRAATTS